MSQRAFPLGHTLRLAVVKRVAKTFIECEYLGHTGEKPFKCTVPHPYAGRGCGVLAGIERDIIVLVAKGPAERNFVVATVPDRTYNFDQSGVENTNYDTTGFPTLEEGQITVKAFGGPSIDLLPSGHLIVEAGAGDDESDIELSSATKSMFTRVDNTYKFTEAGREINGIVQRNLTETESQEDADTINFLSGNEYNAFLKNIGRSPTDEVQNRTTKFSRDFVRNPSLVEKRSVTYEYANSFGIKNMSSEAQASLAIDKSEGLEHLQINNGDRDNRRTDILNLNLFNYNHLIEKVEGTVVDIYGNVLDINRNIINVPDTSTLDISTGNEDGLKDIYRYLRRSIKYHMEINSRKEGDGTAIPSGIGEEHSRWSVDVDGEGLTKINIPASSNTGNIPVLGRYITSTPDDPELRGDGKHRDGDFIDVRMFAFGTDGVKIDNSEYSPVNTDNSRVSAAGTPYHDLADVAGSIFSSGKFKNTAPGSGAESVPPIASKVNNKIGDTDANAGGRSVSAHLDGSLEMSIGADNVDGKSLVLDLEGGVVSHYGRDKNGRSVIHQTDGDVLIQIGGKGSKTSDVQINKDGSLEIHLNRSSGSAQKVIIDSQGITVDVQGNAVFSASGDMTLSAGGRLLMAGEVNFMYGEHDSSISGTRAVKGTERLVVRNGIPNHL